MISYLDKLIQPSYALFVQIRPLATPRAFLSNAWHFDLQVVTVIMQHLSRLIDGDVMLVSRSKG